MINCKFLFADHNAFPCNECGKKFLSIEKLTEHEFIHKENTNHTYPKEKLFNCDQCGKSWVNYKIFS